MATSPRAVVVLWLTAGILATITISYSAYRSVIPIDSYSHTYSSGGHSKLTTAKALFEPGRRPTDLDRDVTVVASRPSSRLPHWDCVDLPHSPKPEVKICIYPVKKDVWVSAPMKNGRLFEENYVLQIAAILKANPDHQLVDFGANIGIYTIFAAAAGTQVLAVDMLPNNIRMIQTSLYISGLEDKVTLVNNGLYSDHRELTAKFIKNNVGGTHLNASEQSSNFVHEKHDPTQSVTVKTVCIDDLLPLLKSKKVVMKIDIERTEAKALTCAHRFFSQADVRLVFMEWVEKSPWERETINDFMGKYGFTPSRDPSKIVPVNTNVPFAPGNNVFFVKKAMMS